MATLVGYRIPSQTEIFSNLNVDEAVRCANSTVLLSETIFISDPENEERSTNDVVQELYRKGVNIHDFIYEQSSTVSDLLQIGTLLSAPEEVTSALTQYRKLTEREKLVAVGREFERLKLHKDACGAVLRPAQGQEDEELESNDLEEVILANKKKPLT
ncbi:hypothetical protein BC938DRAFT_475517 [Jimgerdemannia flammicorona]|uniref:Uncharacterized protein n=1 Tax=Jimgerdemannia flammicorona TaxID=994334 RepID=A0A433QRI6_9FUNG|nr:hypothetical protein BC938DRAFT_475517 [Jimgerdemannia flammicorona]